jgi:hypothetical protein
VCYILWFHNSCFIGPKRYADDLPEQAVKAIQTAARLGNKRFVKILEAVVQEADALEMET